MKYLEKKNIEARLTLDLLPVAEQIEAAYRSVLLPPPPGIYMTGKVDPVIDLNKDYYVREGSALVRIGDINTVTTAVYDKNERMILPSAVMRNKETILSGTPDVPYRGIMIAASVVEHTIDTFIQWRQTRSDFFGKMSRHFAIDTLKDEDYTAIVDSMTVDLAQELYEWFDGKSWNVFLATRKNTSVQIERYGDYRIMDWMERYEKGEIKL